MSGSERSPSPQRSATPPRSPTPPSSPSPPPRSPTPPRSPSPIRPPSRSPPRERSPSPQRSPPRSPSRHSSPRRSPTPQHSASRSPSRHSSRRSSHRSGSSGRRSGHHEGSRSVSRSPSRHSSRRSSRRSYSSERAMSNHQGSERVATRSPSHHSSQAHSRSKSPSRSRSRSRSSERIRNEHNEANINNEHNEVHNNQEHRETHDSHNIHHGSHNSNLSSNTTYNNYTTYTAPPISPYRSNRNTQHRSTYTYPEDELFPGMLSYPSRTSRGYRDEYYGRDERYRRSGFHLPNPGTAGVGALGLAAGALGGFLGGNAMNNNNGRNNNRVVERPPPPTSRPSNANYTNYSSQPYASRYTQDDRREDISRREQRRRNAPKDGRSWLVDERRNENRDPRNYARDSGTSTSNRDAAPSGRESGRESRDKKPRERSDWDHGRPSLSRTETISTPPVRYQGDSIDLGRGFAQDRSYETEHPVGGSAREYRADVTIKEAGVNPYDKPPSRKSSKRGSSKPERGSGSKGESKSKTESSSSKMSGGYDIPLDRLVAPSGAIPESSTGRIPTQPMRTGRKDVTAAAPTSTTPAYGGHDVELDRSETLADFLGPNGPAPPAPGGMGGRMPEGVRLEKRPSRIGTFMGKLCGSARA